MNEGCERGPKIRYLSDVAGAMRCPQAADDFVARDQIAKLVNPNDRVSGQRLAAPGPVHILDEGRHRLTARGFRQISHFRGEIARAKDQ